MTQIEYEIQERNRLLEQASRYKDERDRLLGRVAELTELNHRLSAEIEQLLHNAIEKRADKYCVDLGHEHQGRPECEGFLRAKRELHG